MDPTPSKVMLIKPLASLICDFAGVTIKVTTRGQFYSRVFFQKAVYGQPKGGLRIRSAASWRKISSSEDYLPAFIFDIGCGSSNILYYWRRSKECRMSIAALMKAVSI